MDYSGSVPSAKPDVSGAYKDTVTFTYITNSGKEIKFKTGNVGKVINDNGGEELLKEIELKLNASYKNKLDKDGIDELDLLEEDTMTDNEDIIQEEEE